MEKQFCSLCKSKAQSKCGLCECVVCKKCAHYVAEDTFYYLPEIPTELSHGVYCPQCFAATIKPQLDIYEETLARAKNVDVFSKKQSKETRLVKRSNKVISVKNCTDYDELILRLAFIAAQENFNTIFDLDIKSKKVKNAAYSNLIWDGTARPASFDNKRKIFD